MFGVFPYSLYSQSCALSPLGDALPSKGFEGHQRSSGSPYAREGGGGEGKGRSEGGERSTPLCTQRHEDGDCGELATHRNCGQGVRQN